MSTFCPVAPIQVLEPLHAYEPKTIRNNLFLAHDVVKPDRIDRYKKLFGAGSHFRHYSFMDNSVVELGNAVTADMVAEAYHATNSDVYVLPDVYRNGPATTDAIASNYREWEATMGTASMVVIQGSSLPEWLQCLEEVSRIKKFAWIAIPRVTLEWSPNRTILIEYVRAYFPQSRIHLLGFGDNIAVDLLDARHPYVSSIDSAVPLRLASQGVDMSILADAGPRGDWWDTAVITIYTAHNIHRCHELFYTRDQIRSVDISI